MKKLQIISGMLILSLLALMVAGCVNNTKDSVIDSDIQISSSDSYTGNNFRFLISDDVNAIDDFSSVNVTISTIGVQTGGESGSWQELVPHITEVDLKPLSGENALEIWSGNLTAGTYSKVFIYVTEVKGILLNGERVDVKLPSDKLQISKPFTISENATTAFVYDITVVKAGQSGQYILQPQIAESGADQKFKEVKPEIDKENKPEEVEVKEEEDDEGKPLEDKVWILRAYGESGNYTAVLEDTEITIEFDSSEMRAAGSAGCNTYFTVYEIDGTGIAIPGPIGSTKMACSEPVMEQEQDYLSLLETAESFVIDDDDLVITCGSKVLVFELEE